MIVVQCYGSEQTLHCRPCLDPWHTGNRHDGHVEVLAGGHHRHAGGCGSNPALQRTASPP